MDKRKIFTAIMAISMLITTFSGCSSNQKQSYGNLGKGDESATNPGAAACQKATG